MRLPVPARVDSAIAAAFVAFKADLSAVEATAREALAEMRRLFGVLRSDGESASLAPQPGLHELDPLVQQVRTSDLEVHVEVEGDRYELPPGVDLAAYRIVQEALTNTPLRHSGARCARVVLDYSPPARLGVVVEDDGRWPPFPYGRRRDVPRHRRDQGMVRAGFRSLLEGEPDLEVVGEAANGEEAVEVVLRLRPDVTLMDIRIPVLDGIAATRRLAEAGAPTRVLV